MKKSAVTFMRTMFPEEDGYGFLVSDRKKRFF